MPKRNRADTSKSVEPSKKGPHRTCAQREGAPSVSPFTQNQSVQSPCSSMTLIRSPARGESRDGLTAGSEKSHAASIEQRISTGSSTTSPVRIVFASDGIQSKSGGTVMLTGDSLQTMVVVLQDGKARVLAFQNTRRRPITDGDSASVWREFDSLWSRRPAKSNV